MSNFNVIDLNEYMRKSDVCTQIRDGKKLKTRPGDFRSIVSTTIPRKVEEKPMEFENLGTMTETIKEVKEEPSIDEFKFDHFQNEEIDINKIKNLGDNYKGHTKTIEVKKPKEEQKEEAKEEAIRLKAVMNDNTLNMLTKYVYKILGVYNLNCNYDINEEKCRCCNRKILNLKREENIDE